MHNTHIHVDKIMHAQCMSCVCCSRGFATNGRTAAQHKGTIHRPLITIPLDHIIVDELHFFLRVFDVLLRNLILLAILKDKELQGRNGTHLQNLVNIIKSCGVSFDVWESETSIGCHEWTSLTGGSKKKVLKVHVLSLSVYTRIAKFCISLSTQLLPPKIKDIPLPSVLLPKVVKLWKVSCAYKMATLFILIYC